MADKQYSEPEEKVAETVNAPFDPIGQPINEKSYTRPNVNFSAQDMQTDIPEPQFKAPPIDLGKPDLGKGAPAAAAAPKKEPPPPFNPEMRDLPKKEKQAYAGHAAEMIFNLYKWGTSAANKALLFSEKKMNKLASDGEIDFQMQIPYDFNTNSTMSIAEFVNEYNSQQQNALTVSKDFEDEAKPLLEKVLAKRGVGMSDEQMLMFLVGQDISVKAVQVISAISTKNQMINMWKEMSSANPSGAKTQPAPNFTPPPPPPPPPPAPEGPGPSYVNPSMAIEDINEVVEEANDEYTEPATVQETVDAQLQRKTVKELRQEKIEAGKRNAEQRKPRRKSNSKKS